MNKSEIKQQKKSLERRGYKNEGYIHEQGYWVYSHPDNPTKLVYNK